MIVLHSKEDGIGNSKEELSRLQRKADTMINQLSEAAKYLREGYAGNPFHVIQIPSREGPAQTAEFRIGAPGRMLSCEPSRGSNLVGRLRPC